MSSFKNLWLYIVPWMSSSCTTVILLYWLRFWNFKLLMAYVLLECHDYHVMSQAVKPCLDVTKVNLNKVSEKVHLMVLNMLL